MLFGRTSNLFDDFFGDMFGGDFFDTSSRMPQLMKTDVVEKDGQYMLDVELPGYDKNDISAELKDGYLTIMANKDQTIENKDEKSNYVRKELYTGRCQRSFYVGDDVKEEDIQAGFKDGILKIAVRKPELKEIKDDRKLIPIL